MDKVNNKTIPVVAGGLIDGNLELVFSRPTKTTELLLNGEWKEGTYYYSLFNFKNTNVLFALVLFV